MFAWIVALWTLPKRLKALEEHKSVVESDLGNMEGHMNSTLVSLAKLYAADRDHEAALRVLRKVIDDHLAPPKRKPGRTKARRKR